MQFVAGNWYHIYNRGNNRQQIFYQERNYHFFLAKVKKYLTPHCDIVAYVLMPNHFHFLIAADERTEQVIAKKNFSVGVLSEGFRLLLSAYTKGINKQEGRTGNLIQQNTKSKCVLDRTDHTATDEYAITCFHYIHQNPVKAGLTDTMSDWPFSSFDDYSQQTVNPITNIERGCCLVDIDCLVATAVPYRPMSEESIQSIF